ncbi:MAG: nuclear transport factor 2 family protein [Acidobacteriota bacterium]
MEPREIGESLVELCRQGKNLEAIDKFYSPDIVSVEAQAAPGMPAEMKGIDAIRGKNKWWIENHEIHSAEAKGPYVLDDRFSVVYNFDVTSKAGPQEGNRMQMEEVAVYTVKDGKIAREEFMY